MSFAHRKELKQKLMLFELARVVYIWDSNIHKAEVKESAHI